MNKARGWSYALYAILYIAIFSFVGVFNLAVAQWDFQVLYTAQYWSKTIMETVTYIFAFQVSVYMGADLAESSSAQYKKVNDEVEKSVNKVDDTFNDFAYDDNIKLKTKAWKDKKNAQLIKLNNKMPHKTLMDSKKPRDKWKFKTRRWMKKKERLIREVSTEWINSNIEYVKINYPKYSPQEILSGHTSHTTKKKLLDSGIYKKAFFKRILTITVTVMISAFFNVMFFTGSPFSMIAFMGMLVQMILIFVNIISGIHHGMRGFKEVTLNNLFIRRDKLIEYFSKKSKYSEVIDNGTRQPRQPTKE